MLASGPSANTVEPVGLQASGFDTAIFEAAKYRLLMPIIFKSYTP